jgi:hypothetical protein
MTPWLLQTIKSPEFVSVVLTLAVGAIGAYLSPTARVVWGISHGFTFLVPTQGNQPSGPIRVNTGSVFVQNLGRKTAENIEVILNFQPQHFEVWPVLNYETARTPDGHFIVKINNLERNPT